MKKIQLTNSLQKSVIEVNQIAGIELSDRGNSIKISLKSKGYMIALYQHEELKLEDYDLLVEAFNESFGNNDLVKYDTYKDALNKIVKLKKHMKKTTRVFAEKNVRARLDREKARLVRIELALLKKEHRENKKDG